LPSFNFPSAPVNSLAIHPEDSNYLIAGTSVGLLFSRDGGANWMPGNTNFVYTNVVHNITISVDDELWKLVREAAAEDRISMNAFIRKALSRTVLKTEESAAARFANLAEAMTPSTVPWKWDRNEIYEDTI